MMNNRKVLILTVVIGVPVFCLVLVLMGATGFFLTSAVTSASGSPANGMTKAEVDAEIVNIATDYADAGDLEIAEERLAALRLPNAGQYVAFMVDRYIQERGARDDVETQSLFMLADALGTSTDSMVAALSTPTPAPTDTPTPTPTSILPTPTDTPTITPLPTSTPLAPIDTPIPTDTPEPPTPTPGPPTNTPEPTPTPEPTKPPVDYVVAEAYLIPNPTYNTCPGNHQIYVTVVDSAGNPLDGVTVEDTGRAVPPHLSGEKGPGKLEYDLWNNGFSLEVTKKLDGSPATSEVTPKLSSVDEDIPNEWLIQANYCKDMNDCVARKSNNQLCRGHYAYNVTFKKTY